MPKLELTGGEGAPAALAEPPAAPGGADALDGSAAVLVVDDEPGMRNFLSKSLRPHCALVEAADSAEAAEELRRRCHFDLLIVDIRLPGRSGVEWLEELRRRDVRTDVVVMTAYANLDTAVAALRAGAADFLLKPFRIEQMMAAVRRCLERRRMQRENFLLRRAAPAPGLEGLVGDSPSMLDVAATVRRVAASPATVLIEGETGTGKELVARALHAQSGRKGAFVPVNCGSIPPELLESELFGHVRGAFTSAHETREGLFTYAHEGTLFLDEISELAPSMQSKLLRVLEDKAVRPVGSDRLMPVDARVVAATNRTLREAVDAGRFREDLFYRLDVLAIRVPPLRERPSDVAALAEHFSRVIAGELGVAPIPFSHEDMKALAGYRWPGNVRELRNVIERSLLLGRLPADWTGAAAGRRDEPPPSAPVEWSLAEVERNHIERVLEASGGNKSKASRTLGISRKTLERKLKAWAEES